jgi:hypothetical protein
MSRRIERRERQIALDPWGRRPSLDRLRWSARIVAVAAALCRIAAVAAALFLIAPAAVARTSTDTQYTKAQTYSAALRYLRVDRSYEVVEQNAEAAYLLFKYVIPGQSKVVSGSIEIVELEDKIRLVVQLPKLPSYHEQVLRDDLLKKLKDEYGEPVQPKPEPNDEDDDADEDGEDTKKRGKSPKSGDRSGPKSGNESDSE